MSYTMSSSQGKYSIISSIILCFLLVGCSTPNHESDLSNSTNLNGTVTITSESPVITPTEKPSSTFIPYVTRTKTPTPVLTAIPTVVYQKAVTPSPHPDAISLSNISNLKQFARLGNGVANSVAWSPDGKTIVVTSDIEIDFYDASTMELKFSLDDMRAGQIVFNPVGNRIAVTVNQDVLILEAETGKIEKKFPSNIAWIRKIGFSPDGGLLAGVGLTTVGSDYSDYLLEVWDVFTEEKLYFREGPGSMTGIAFSPDGKNLAVGDFTGVVLLDSFTGDENNSFGGETYSVGFRPDGSLVMRKNNSEIVNLDPDSGEALVTIKTNGFDEFYLSPDGNTLVDERTWDDDRQTGVAKLWDMDSGSLIQTIDYQTEYKSVAFSPDSSKLAIVDYDSVVQIWDICNNKLLDRIEYSSEVTGLAFKPQTSTSSHVSYSLAAGYYRGQVWLWDINTQTILKSYVGHTSTINHVTFSPDGQTLVSSSYDHSTKIWMTDSGQLLTTIDSQNDNDMDQAGYLFDGQQMFTESGRLVQLWDTTTWKVIHRWNGFTDAHFLDGKLVAYKPDEHTLVFLDKETSEVYLTLPMLEVDYLWFTNMVISPDGKYITGDTQEGMIYIWNVEQDQLITSFTGHAPANAMGDVPAIYDLAFSPFDSILVSAGFDGTVKFWNAQNGNLLKTFDFQGESVRRLAFSQDGRYLAAGVEDGTIRIWSIVEP